MEPKTHLIKFWKEHLPLTAQEIDAFNEVKRENFIPPELKAQAYVDVPLPLLRGKTISQPTTVMLMTHALEIEPGMKVFEVGTGSGYQSAILSKLVEASGSVVSTEVVPELVNFAKENLQKANITNVIVLEEDGSKGFEKEAPYDRIILTAASREFPKELLAQLKSGGIIVGPVGDANEQEMVKGIKDNKGKLSLEFLGQFLFSPLYGKYGFED